MNRPAMEQKVLAALLWLHGQGPEDARRHVLAHSGGVTEYYLSASSPRRDGAFAIQLFRNELDEAEFIAISLCGAYVDGSLPEMERWAATCAAALESALRNDLRAAVLNMLDMDPGSASVIAECVSLVESSVAEAVHEP